MQNSNPTPNLISHREKRSGFWHLGVTPMRGSMNLSAELGSALSHQKVRPVDTENS